MCCTDAAERHNAKNQQPLSTLSRLLRQSVVEDPSLHAGLCARDGISAGRPSACESQAIWPRQESCVFRPQGRNSLAERQGIASAERSFRDRERHRCGTAKNRLIDTVHLGLFQRLYVLTDVAQ